MRQCLTHPEGGYYTRQTGPGQDQFGTKGDFVTSPEISQIFGELIGIWLYAEWLGQGKPTKVQLVEVGPGRGTLMDDVLRVFPIDSSTNTKHNLTNRKTISTFKAFTNSIDSIYLIETSPYLRKQQAKVLSSTEHLQENELGSTASCKYIPGCNIQWCDDIRLVPKGEPHARLLIFDANMRLRENFDTLHTCS